ncbi:hypothetical protein C0993_011469 [Termitomyces sp. T159_Od127]|nr:hypothetical protein C0993_011469 [Termitomyces sp. T159_Od127]
MAEINIDEGLAALRFEDRTVLEYVMRSDARHERAFAEVKRPKNTKDPFAVIGAIRKLKHERHIRAYNEMIKIAAWRSGARGPKACKDLLAAEERVAASAALLQEPRSEIDAKTMQEEIRKAVDAIADIQTSLDAMDSASAEACAHRALWSWLLARDYFKAVFDAIRWMEDTLLPWERTFPEG